MSSSALNVLGTPLQTCSMNPLTGFYRTGCCETGPEDAGAHMVCVVATDEFLEFSRSRGNDLITPHPIFRFPGLKAGDRWCLCVTRWIEAYEAGVAPNVVLEATHAATLEWVSLDQLKKYAVPADAS